MQYTPKGFEAILGRFRGEIRGVCGEGVVNLRNFSIPHKEKQRKSEKIDRTLPLDSEIQNSVFLARGTRGSS